MSRIVEELICPKCNSQNFLAGPRGGAAHNVRCNTCGYWMNIALIPRFIPGTYEVVSGGFWILDEKPPEGRLLTKEERDKVYDDMPANSTVGEERIAFCKAQFAKDLAHEQTRIERLFKEIEEHKVGWFINTNGTLNITRVDFRQGEWQELKRREGIE